MDRKNKKSFAYKLGYVFGCICIACVTAIIVASTVKFMMWIF